MKISVALTALALCGVTSASSQAVTATAHVVITGGSNPGTYDLQVAKGGCSSGATGKGSFGTQISDIKVGPTALGSVQLLIPKPSVAGSQEFQMVVRIGSLLKKTAEFNHNSLADGQKTGGKGTVTVNDAGATATLSFDVTTAAGVHLVGVVDCKSVVRM